MIPSKQITFFITAGMLLYTGASAQQQYRLKQEGQKPLASQPLLSPAQKRVLSDRQDPKFGPASQLLGAAAISGTKVGTTQFDLQTNASMPNRLAYYDDGEKQYVHMAWMAADAPNNQSRGSFYTRFNVSDTNAIVLAHGDWQRMEAVKTGWTSLVNLEGNKPAFIAHRGGEATLSFTRGSDPLQGDIQGTEGALWPRAANDDYSGGPIHVIYTYNTGDKAWKLGYVRSNDNGGTWSAESFLGDNVNQGDAYAIASRGSNVAVVYSDKDFNLYLIKSSDGGANWSEKQLVSAPNYSDATEISVIQGDSVVFKTNTVETPGSNMDVILDDEGMAHLVFNIIPTYRNGTGVKNGSGEIARIGMDSIPVEEVKALYYPEIGMYAFTEGSSQLTPMAPPAGGTFDGNGVVVSRQYGSGFSRYPQLGIDENNVVYCVYSSVKNGDTKTVNTGGSDLTGLFGHVYATHKTASSVWSNPVDLTESGKDYLFPSLANRVEKNRMFIGYSADNTPGDFITNTDLPTENVEIFFSAVPTSMLNSFVTSADNNAGIENTSVEITPNPARNISFITLNAPVGTPLEVNIYNALGEKMANIFNGSITAESTRIPVETAGMAAGAYFCTVSASGRMTTKYFSVIP